MSDDAMVQVFATGGSVVAGGGVSAVMVRFLFASFKEQLSEISATLKASITKGDERHERLLERITTVENEAKAAHRRLDEMQRRRK